VADDAGVLRRVQLSRMSVDYAIVERARTAPDKPPLGPLAARRFGPFIETLQSCDLTRIREGDVLNKADYRRQLAETLKVTGDPAP
jgi:hypothetical protein